MDADNRGVIPLRGGCQGVLKLVAIEVLNLLGSLSRAAYEQAAHFRSPLAWIVRRGIRTIRPPLALTASSQAGVKDLATSASSFGSKPSDTISSVSPSPVSAAATHA